MHQYDDHLTNSRNDTSVRQRGPSRARGVFASTLVFALWQTEHADCLGSAANGTAPGASSVHLDIYSVLAASRPASLPVLVHLNNSLLGVGDELIIESLPDAA